MKNISFFFLSENFPFLVVKFSVYLNRRVFIMSYIFCHYYHETQMKAELEKKSSNTITVNPITDFN